MYRSSQMDPVFKKREDFVQCLTINLSKDSFECQWESIRFEVSLYVSRFLFELINFEPTFLCMELVWKILGNYVGRLNTYTVEVIKLCAFGSLRLETRSFIRMKLYNKLAIQNVVVMWMRINNIKLLRLSYCQ